MTTVIEARVHDAVAANVDLMPGPDRILERAVASAEALRRRRMRRRVAALAAGTCAVVAVLAGTARS